MHHRDLSLSQMWKKMIFLNGLSRAGVNCAGGRPCGKMLRLCSDLCHNDVITLSQVRLHKQPIGFDCQLTAQLCENPVNCVMTDVRFGLWCEFISRSVFACLCVAPPGDGFHRWYCECSAASQLKRDLRTATA